MSQWDSYNDPFLNDSSHGDEAERIDNNMPPMAPMPTGAMPTGVMPMAYYPPVVPHGYWCPPMTLTAPLVSPAHLDHKDEFDSPDMMPPAPPLHLGTMPNVAPASVSPMGENENVPPLSLGGAAAPYDMVAPHMGAEPNVAGMTSEAVPNVMPSMTPGVLPSMMPGHAPCVPMCHPPVAPMPYAPVVPHGGYCGTPQPGMAPYVPGFPMPYGPYR
ncbi:hypothetical protein [Geobacillus thermodenitrificans]|uniref:hypothetical protein n=1 Tax=Geobacillus thermodenitrificans TaxID=33940 RepID=UPI002E1E9ED0|nr:hypothetical protein [Geobacillus thermodenitrificans]MED4917781.1 hypothetical protein [Geobacillus thermodenitrificans]